MSWDHLVSWLLTVALFGSLIFLVLQCVLAVRVRRHEATEAVAGERWLRRCNACGSGWKATIDDNPSKRALQQHRRDNPDRQRLPASWKRCPHCYSTDVRMSGAGAPG